MSIPFLLDEKPTVVPGGSAGERSGGARKVPYGAARSNSERAAPSACVGKRYCAPHRRMQAKAVRVDTQLWSGGPGRARQALQAQHFLPGAWAEGDTEVHEAA